MIIDRLLVTVMTLVLFAIWVWGWRVAAEPITAPKIVTLDCRGVTAGTLRVRVRFAPPVSDLEADGQVVCAALAQWVPSRYR